MRIAVAEGHRMHQRAARLEHLDNVIVGLGHVLAGEQLGTGDKLAVISHRAFDRQAVLHAHQIILESVARCRVNHAGAGLGGNVIAQDDRYLAVVERVTQADAFEVGTATIGNDAIVIDAVPTHGVLHQRFGQQPALGPAIGRGFHQRIIELRVQGDGVVRGQGPWRGRPDHDRDRALALVLVAGCMLATRKELLFVDDGKAYIDCRRSLVDILHLRLGQRRAAVRAPVHGLVALVNMPSRHHTTQRANDVGLELMVHGEIRVIPITDHA